MFPRDRARDVDRGWAWLVMPAAILAQIIIAVLLYSLGVIQIVLLDTFDEGLVKTSWVLSITSCLLSLPGPFIGFLTNMTSCRTTMMLGSLLIFMGCTSSAFVTRLDHLYVTLSLMTGMGASMVYTPCLVVIGFYFDKYLSVSIALVVTGGGIGMVAGAPLIGFFENVFGWRGMFMMLAGISANLILSAMICRPNSVERSHWGNRADDSDPSGALKEKPSLDDPPSAPGSRWKKTIKTSLKVVLSVPMLLFCSSIFLWSITISLVNLYLPSYVVFNGATMTQSALLFTVMGVCNIVSRLLAGFTVAFVDKFVLYSASFAVMAVLVTGFPFIPPTFTMSMAFAGLMGLCTGGPYVVLTSMTKDLAGLAHLATAFGIEMMVSGTGSLIGPPVAALLAESSGSYLCSFVFAGISCACSAVLGFVLIKFKHPTDVAELDINNPECVSPPHSRPSSVLYASQLSIPGVPSPYLEIRSRTVQLQVPSAD
ncbi:monocarboxylate transporter 12-like [Liolophura sinensis]|uniref:monocarboxylate transporter 12-like n=1 Tax=Liolophura sinensis TaxID=3198878 RepID=UPI003158D802